MTDPATPSETLQGGLSRTLFFASFTILAFAAGLLVAMNKWFPTTAFRNAAITVGALYNQEFPPSFAPYQFLEWVPSDGRKAADRRLSAIADAPDAAADEHFLLSGGLYEYIEDCPKYGCIAAELTRSGALVHAYPYRPDQFEAHQTVVLPHEEVMFQFTKNMFVTGLVKLPGGDLIAVMQEWNAFPFAGGIARVRPDGEVAWFRKDYSHHWPRLLPDGDIVVPAMRVGGSRLSVPMPHSDNIDLECSGKIEEDIVRILSPDGQVREELSVLDAMLRSPYRAMLRDAPPCDPLHVNYAAPVTDGIRSRFSDVAADDFVVSLRNLSAFAILGRHDNRIKHLFTGTFVRQHSVQPLGQSADMLIFDNQGGDWQSGPSRLLVYNLADHGERTLLGNPDKNGGARFSNEAGNISVSSDFARALVTYSFTGRAYEVRITDGKVLTAFDNVHDLQAVPAAGGGTAHPLGRFYLFTALYAR